MFKRKRKILAQLLSNNIGGSLRQQLRDGAPGYLPLLYTVVPNRGSLTPSFTRATTETGQKYDSAGYLDFTALSGEVIFKGARRERNLVVASENLTTGWSPNGTGSVTETTMVFTGAAGEGWNITGFVGVIGHVYQWRALMSVASGTHTIRFRVSGAALGEVTVMTTPTVFSFTATSVSASAIFGVYNGTTPAAGTVSVTQIQLVDITGETDQTTLRPYVSVGALIRNTQDPLFLSLPGTVGHYAGSPDSVAASITGDIDIRVNAALADWTPAAANMLVSKYIAATNQKAYALQITTTSGRPAFTISTTGMNDVSYTATVGTGFVDGAVGWLRVTRSAATGDVVFYTSSDGAAWTQLGTTQAGTAGAIFDSTAGVEVGSYITGALPATGNIRQAQIYNGISGTLAVDFNPMRDAVTPTGTITSSTTGEVWTLNGASSVIRNVSYHGSCVDGVKCYPTDLNGNPIPRTGSYPLVGYVPWEARTNLCLQSNAFTTAPWTTTLGGLAQDAVGTDGAISAWTLTDNSALVTQTLQQLAITLTAANYTATCFVGKTSGATSFPVMQLFDGVSRVAGCTINTNTGVATVWTSYTALTVQTSSVLVESHNALFWKVSLTFLGTVAATWQANVYPAYTSNAALANGATIDATQQGSKVFTKVDIQLGSFATPYIPTTTVALPRNADLLTYAGAEIANYKAVACTFSRGVGVSNAGHFVNISDGTANNIHQHYINSATQTGMAGVTGGVVEWGGNTSNAYTPGTTRKMASSFGTNIGLSDADGVAQTAGTPPIVAPVVTTLAVGFYPITGLLQCNGPVTDLYFWTRNLSQSELGAVDR